MVIQRHESYLRIFLADPLLQLVPMKCMSYFYAFNYKGAL